MLHNATIAVVRWKKLYRPLASVDDSESSRSTRIVVDLGVARISNDEAWANDDEALEEMSVLASLGELPSLEPEVAAEIVHKLGDTSTPRETTGLAMRIAARMHEHWAPARRAGIASVGAATFRRAGPKVGRNEPCPCGSGEKFKRCCGCN